MGDEFAQRFRSEGELDASAAPTDGAARTILRAVLGERERSIRVIENLVVMVLGFLPFRGVRGRMPLRAPGRPRWGHRGVVVVRCLVSFRSFGSMPASTE